MSKMENKRILITGGSGFIGTHYLLSSIKKGLEILNIDCVAPKRIDLIKYWKDCNILDFEKFSEIFRSFQPSIVLHFAANTNTNGKTLEDYSSNTIGTKNVLDTIKKTPSISRVIITSSQHVRKPGTGLSSNIQEYFPHGLYGESKVITEKFTINSSLDCVWTIIRPTTIWGPYHNHLANGLWKIMKKGLYLHPKNDQVIRSYGYVKNLVWSIDRILEAQEALINKKIYYLGDDLIKQSEWVDAFSLALIGRKTIKIPKFLIYLLSKFGDLVSNFSLDFPMNSSRYFNLTTTNPVPVRESISLFGKPPVSLAVGIEETVTWLNSENILH